MPEVLLSNDDITVLGPPEILEVLVDIGPAGIRGSQVFVGIGDPNDPDTVIGQTPIINDLYINTSPGENYSYMYQYQDLPGGPSWVEKLKINPTIYSNKFSPTYTSGAASITIPIADIVTVSGPALVAGNFNIQSTINNVNPVAVSAVPSVSGTDLTISLKAASYSGSSWSSLSGAVTTYILITIVEV
jgi:hypothetical protein